MNRELLDILLAEISVSGEEFGVQEKLENHMEEFIDSYDGDAIGDGVYKIDGDGEKILFSAHIDEIGLMVSGYTSDGFLKVTNAGGIQARTYPGHSVKISTEKGIIYGSVVNNPYAQKKKEFSVKNLFIDIGAKNKEEAENVCSIGDRIVQDTTPRELLNNRFSARGLDDKTGVFVIMEALKQVKKEGSNNNILCAATVGEEVGAHGAKWVAERTKPDKAIVVDVTYVSDTDGMEDEAWGDICLGRGPVILINPMCDREMVSELKLLAKENDVPYQLEICGGRSFTDGDQIHLAGKGIKTALVSIPLRYMHAPCEVVDLDDLKNTIKLLSLYMQKA